MSQVTHIQPLASGWQQDLANAITSPAELTELLGLPPHWLEGMTRAHGLFRLKVPRHYLGLIRPGDPQDPLLLQVLPGSRELRTATGFVTDPVDDHGAMRLPGLLQKYRGRVLLTLTGACAIHCRYCFRRHYDYADANPINSSWQQTLDYLWQSKDINEVILSGGDPLALDDAKLANIIHDLEHIPHITRIRIHSRLISVLPSRLTSELLSLLSNRTVKVILVTHINHPAEIDPTVAATLQTLAHARLTLLNQSVLLHKVNDSADILVALSEKLFAAGVLPYYLHQLDPVQGAAHFNVAQEQALQLEQTMAAELPGYLVPRLVVETPGADRKLPVRS